jgi:thiamine kinase-like enzyme
MTDVGAIVQRLEGRLGPVAGSPEPLEGGITNRNFKVSFGGRDCVLRLPGKDTGLLGISRDAERIANETAAALGIAPALLAAEPDCMVTEFIACTVIDPAALRADPAPAARALRAFHDSGVALPTRFWVPELLAEYAAVVRDLDPGYELPDAYARARELAHRIAGALPLSDPVPTHADLLTANILIGDGGRLVLVDWEYAGIGHRYFDLGNLAVNNEFDDAAEDRLLAAYFGEPPSDGRRAALKLYRIMSDAREAAWGVIQGVISELDFDFDDYAATHFTRLDRAASDPRLEDWLHAATP